jgi:enoyl-CoA hydratase
VVSLVTDRPARDREWIIHRRETVAIVRFEGVERDLADYRDHHMSLAAALEDVRFDDTVRVVVITGGDDIFELGPRREGATPVPVDLLDLHVRGGGSGSIRGPWSLSQGLERTFAALALMEKPVVGRLSGDAFGFALHILLGCDIVIAREDVIVLDPHLAMNADLPWAMAAGDGAFAFLPLFLPPAKFKEFILLGPSWTGKQLADLGLVNYAVPASALDSKVEEIVNAFLSRPPAPLIRTKRAINKMLVQQTNLTLDYSWAAQATDLWELSATGFVQDLTLRPDDVAWTLTPTEEQAQGR